MATRQVTVRPKDKDVAMRVSLLADVAVQAPQVNMTKIAVPINSAKKDLISSVRADFMTLSVLKLDELNVM